MNSSLILKTLSVSVALAALSACSTMDVRTDSAAAANLGACRSWSWADAPAAARPNAFNNPLNERRLRDAIAQRLQSRGMTAAADGAGDCQVAYSVGSRTVIENGFTRPRFGFGLGFGAYGGYGGYGGYGRWGGGPGGSLFWDAPYAYSEHRVAVDLFQGGEKRQPLWHASVDLNMAQLSGADAERRIDAAVAAMFAKYPGSPRQAI